MGQGITRVVWRAVSGSALVALAACSGGGADSLDNASLGADGGARDARVTEPDADEPSLDADEPSLDAGTTPLPDATACVPVAEDHAFELVTRGSDDALPTSFYNSGRSDITPDGRYVVFVSSETALVDPPSNGRTQVFLRDRERGMLELISLTANGEPGNSDSDVPAISDDGCRVVFESAASDLVSGDSNGARDIFLRDRCADAPITERVSVDRAGAPFTLGSGAPDISGDGDTITFHSAHPQGTGDIFVYTRARAFAEAITNGNGSSQSPAISADGARIAFWSYADDLVSGDDNDLWDIFLYDAGASPTISLVSSATDGTAHAQGQEGSSTVSAPGISGDGRVVSFRSRGAGLVGAGDGESQVYVKDIESGAMSVVSVNASGELGNGPSAGSGQGYRPSLSYDGNVVVYASAATNLDPTADAQGKRIVIHDRARAENIAFEGFAYDDVPVVSGDVGGRFVSGFATGKLDPDFDMNGVFVLDRDPPPSACD